MAPASIRIGLPRGMKVQRHGQAEEDQPRGLGELAGGLVGRAGVEQRAAEREDLHHQQREEHDQRDRALDLEDPRHAAKPRGTPLRPTRSAGAGGGSAFPTARGEPPPFGCVPPPRLTQRLGHALVGSVLGTALLSSVLVESPPASTAPRRGRPREALGRARRPAEWVRGGLPGTERSLRRSRAAWVYNWGPEPTFRVPRGVRFVPTIWGAAFATPEALAKAKAHGPDLLTFNEPELGSQANMTVGQAVRLWPTLEATGMRLAAPRSPATPASPVAG